MIQSLPGASGPMAKPRAGSQEPGAHFSPPLARSALLRAAQPLCLPIRKRAFHNLTSSYSKWDAWNKNQKYLQTALDSLNEE